METSTNLSNLLDFLPNSENPTETLNDIKTVLFAVHPSSLKEVVPNVSFDVIFNCLNTDDSDQIAACCAVLLRLLSAVDATVVLHQFHNELLTGMKHPVIGVKELTLNQVLRAAEASAQQVSQYQDVLLYLLSIFGEESLEAAKLSSQVLVQLAGSSEALAVLFSDQPYQQLLNVMDQGDIIRYRIYEALVSMAAVSSESLQHCSPLLQRLCNEMDGDDILLQLNCLELVGRLASTNHGYTYLQQQGTITRLETRLKDLDRDPMAGLLLSGLLKVFGQIGYRQPEEVCRSLQPVLHQTFQCTASPDIVLRTVAIETIGYIGSTPEGKHSLSKQGNRMSAVCHNIAKTMSSAPTEIQIKACGAATDLITLQVSAQSAELLDVVQQWFTDLCPEGVSSIQRRAGQPFPELRMAALRLLRALAEQAWGQSLLLAQPGFFEYLLDRSTEKETDGKRAKFDVVETLVQSPTANNVLGRETMVKMRAYHMEGPFFVQVESAVAYEGE